MIIILTGIKIKLKPTKEQEELFWKSAGVARWSYNYFLSECEKNYENYLNGKSDKKYINEKDVRKHVNNVLKKTTHTWLSEVGSNVMKQGIKDADLAMKRFFNGITSRPKFKSRHKSKISFYVNYESLKRMPHGFKGERLGYVKSCQPLPKLKSGEKYLRPRITYDGKDWYLSVAYEKEFEKFELTNNSLGIDVGIEKLAVCSNGKIYKNINKTKRVKQLEKKLRREHRKLSRKIESNIAKRDVNDKPVYKKPLSEMKNIQKQNNEIRSLYKKLSNIRRNYLHQCSNEIVKTKPFRIVMESLNIKGMMKNKHMSFQLQKQCLFELKRQVQYKSERHGIEFIEASQWFPSSKTCSCCGKIKKNLKLSDRIYKCECGNIIDRDLNAAINLANYQI